MPNFERALLFDALMVSFLEIWELKDELYFILKWAESNSKQSVLKYVQSCNKTLFVVLQTSFISGGTSFAV